MCRWIFLSASLYSIGFYCLCVVSRGFYKHHLLSFSWDENWLKRLFYDQHDASDNCRLEIALLIFL